MWWSRGEQRRPDDEPSVAAECEAFATGRYADAAERWGWPVPMWAWANVLAHRTDTELGALAAGFGQSRGRACDEWGGTVEHLALAVFTEAARTGTPVAEIQESLLVPLESRLIEGEGYQPATPEQFASLVLATLRRHPSSRP